MQDTTGAVPRNIDPAECTSTGGYTVPDLAPDLPPTLPYRRVIVARPIDPLERIITTSNRSTKAFQPYCVLIVLARRARFTR